MKLIYDVNDKPKFSKLLVFAFQQVLAIMAATIAVPTIIGLPTQIPAAIFGAGVGTIVYLLFTRFKSPVFLGSSFAFLSSLGCAMAYGYCGIIVGSILAGLVYVVIAIVIKFAGSHWVSKLMPPVIIGPTVALIGLSLAGNAVGDLVKASGFYSIEYAKFLADKTYVISTDSTYNLIALLCGFVAFITIIICSVQNKFKGLKLIPFIIGIGAGYAVASVFSIFGYCFDVPYLKIVDWSPLVSNFAPLGQASASVGDKVQAFFTYPDFALIEAIKELVNHESSINGAAMISGAGVAECALAFIPVAFVVFAEHIADHKNLGSIINRDLVENEPGLTRTLLGDGVGSIFGTILGICPNTTYGESVGCVAITKNASVRTIFVAAVLCIIISFFSPVMALLRTIPSCVMGGVCFTLYGFIAVSGLKMFKDIDLGDNENLFTVSAILIAGIGGLSINIPYALENGAVSKTVSITAIATALILGIVTNVIIKAIKKRAQKNGDVDEEGVDEVNSLMSAPVEADSTYEVGSAKKEESDEETK